MKRDEEVSRMLEARGIKSAVIWECTVKQMMKSEDKRNETLDSIEAFLRDDRLRLEI